ncbi:hypothetical protein PIROE2DRAFT_13174, partial [Piromyces sp. E2]
YFKDITSLNLKIISSHFKNNYALNGAAFNINSIKKIDNVTTNYLEVIDTEFINNRAEYFGGAIFTDYANLDLVHITNVTFIGNKAYAGGAIYIQNHNFTLTKEIDMKENTKSYTFINNTSESHGNNIATDPSYIEFLSNYPTNHITNLTNGDNLLLEFELKDHFNQIILDNSKIYDDIMIKAIVENEEIYEKLTLNNEILMENNVCFFIKGKCYLKYLKIYSKEISKFQLKLLVEENKNSNHSSSIHFQKNTMNVSLLDCQNNQIKIYSKNNIFYHCENPLCHLECPVENGTAICIPGPNNNNNDRKYNQCKCQSGWTGTKCDIIVRESLK